MDWRNSPSIAALRAFEAAARHASLSAAARGLNVTHAAIARHVRTPEDHFGLSPMQREGQAMALTPEAQPLSRALSEGFATIASAVRDLAAGALRAVRRNRCRARGAARGARGGGNGSAKVCHGSSRIILLRAE